MEQHHSIMKYYFAPLEGLTDSIYRRLHHTYFPGLDKYYTPFLSPTVHRALTAREARELPPADSLGCRCVPQLLTKVPEDFLWMAHQCKDLGYEEVNLNLGCPSGTVTAKGKGSAMLDDHEALSRFLDAVFAGTDVQISVKTRIGFHSAEYFSELLDIFNRYPIKELTVHPRVRDTFYNGPVDMEIFAYALANSRNPVCFNGNLCSLEQITGLQTDYPQLDAVMLGRGLIGDPGMLTPGCTQVSTLEIFYDALLEEYTAAFGGSRNAMFRLKENWRYLLRRFEHCEKLSKRLRKITDIAEYKAITRDIFHSVPLRDKLEPDW